MSASPVSLAARGTSLSQLIPSLRGHTDVLNVYMGFFFTKPKAAASPGPTEPNSCPRSGPLACAACHPAFPLAPHKTSLPFTSAFLPQTFRHSAEPHLTAILEIQTLLMTPVGDFPSPVRNPGLPAGNALSWRGLVGPRVIPGTEATLGPQRLAPSQGNNSCGEHLAASLKKPHSGFYSGKAFDKWVFPLGVPTDHPDASRRKPYLLYPLP